MLGTTSRRLVLIAPAVFFAGLTATSCQVSRKVGASSAITCRHDGECPPEFTCYAATQTCRSLNAPPTRCGDGVLDEGEACDCGDSDTNLGKDCSGPNSREAPNRCRINCTLPRCGDGGVDRDEGCDDGNQTSGDGCSAICVVERCGNGVVDQGEICDDGNFQGGDGCSADCLSNESCGNGYPDFDAGELCDCGTNAAALPGGCVAENGAAGTTCTAGCDTIFCGNGVINPGEACDDGNSAALDGCTPDCQSTEVCGNGYRDFLLGEECDDANITNHDGCTSRCTQELPQWTLLNRERIEVGRAAMTMAYDARRNRIVLFGGNSGEFKNDTWEYDGSAWRQIVTAHSPPARSEAAMAYDSVRGRIVLFGGYTQTFKELSDTWEFTGFDWVEVATAVSPPARRKHMLTYDSSRRVMVLFGGSYLSTALNDTWEYNGTNWVAGPSPHPSLVGRWWSAMAFHPGKGTVVLHGGENYLGAAQSDTWEYNGSAWSPITTTAFAKARHTFTYAPGINGLVMYSGTETRHYVGTSYSTISTPAAPAGPSLDRQFHAATYDASRARVVIFGGASGLQYRGETWEYAPAAQTWAQGALGASHAPDQYRGAATFDTNRGRLIVFGGDTRSDPVGNETWEFDGNNWQRITIGATPPERRLHAMAFHEERNVAVMFSGGSAPNDTCLYRAATGWACSTPTNSPVGRFFHTMAYDPARQVVVMFGGGDGSSTMLQDVWEHDGTTNSNAWVNKTPALIPENWPARRRSARMAWDASRQKVVMFGGYDQTQQIVYGDTWAWDGTSWELINAGDPNLSTRLNVGLGFNSPTGSLLLYAGEPQTTVAAFTDTWALQADGSWQELALFGFPTPTRVAQTLVTDNQNRRLLSFGGLAWSPDISAFDYSSDVYAFQYTSEAPDENCLDGVDNDADAAVDCADPDCAPHRHCAAPCADGTSEQTIAPGMAGCSGQVTFANRATLCGPAARVCSAAEWMAFSSAAPLHHYWTNDFLERVGVPGSCYATLSGTGTPCPGDSPMRVCAGATDSEGNTCAFTACGFDAALPSQSFGGCTAADTAGTLCCTR